MKFNDPKPFELAESDDGVMLDGGIGLLKLEPQPDGRVFEQYCRPPGSRTIVVSPEGKILITREHRREAGSYDLRLPGGKVFNRYDEWQKFLADGGDELKAAMDGAGTEVREEAGIIIRSPQHIVTAHDGTTVQWDLYYFLVTEYDEHKQELGAGEDIEPVWMSPTEIIKAIEQGQMQEWRSVGVLLGLVLPKLN